MPNYQVTIKVTTPYGYKDKTTTGIVFGKKKKTKAEIESKALAFVKEAISEANKELQMSFKVTKMVKLKDDFMFNYD